MPLCNACAGHCFINLGWCLSRKYAAKLEAESSGKSASKSYSMKFRSCNRWNKRKYQSNCRFSCVRLCGSAGRVHFLLPKLCVNVTGHRCSDEGSLRAIFGITEQHRLPLCFCFSDLQNVRMYSLTEVQNPELGYPCDLTTAPWTCHVWQGQENSDGWSWGCWMWLKLQHLVVSENFL